MRAAFFSVK